MSSPLVTGEAVALDLRTAGVASRMIAAVLDFLLQLLLLLGLTLLVGLFGGAGSGAALAALVVTSLVLTGLVYPVAFETLLRGRTPGKIAMGLRVVREDAGPISFRQSFVRGLIGFIVERPGISFGSAAVLSSLLSESGKRLGDLAAGTVVIQERVAAPKTASLQMPPPLAAWATTLDLSRLPDDLAQSARTFLSRSASMTPAAQADLGGKLTAAVAAVVTPAPPPGTPGWAYLTAVLVERRRRAEAQSVALPVAPPAALTAPTPAPAVPLTKPTSPPDPPPSGGFVLPS